jgi:hypothetical protein
MELAALVLTVVLVLVYISQRIFGTDNDLKDSTVNPYAQPRTKEQICKEEGHEWRMNDLYWYRQCQCCGKKENVYGT